MKTHIEKLFLLPALIAALGLILTGRVTAQTFTNLYNFSAAFPSSGSGLYTNSDGANPVAGLILSGNTLYGTAYDGGSLGWGTVFKVNPDGTGFTNLHSFTNSVSGTHREGANPQAGLILSGNTLYGTASAGGTNGAGMVFKANTDATGFTNLYSFTAISGPYPSTNSDGAAPGAGLILSGNALYGTAQHGGSLGYGTVFEINTDGTDFTNLHSFTATSGSLSTNSDGTGPSGSLLLSGNTLYGTARYGGSSGRGTMFKVNTNGTGFTNLHSFTNSVSGTNSDGASPNGGLILSGNTLYGTAYYGGTNGNGTVFKVNTDGTGFTNLHSFTALPPPSYTTNSDGANPIAGLILSGNTLYGTASAGGTIGDGTVFAVNTDGTGFTNLHSFTNSDGYTPQAGLILSGNTLYGTATFGGTSGYGTVFSLTLGSVSAPAPTLTIFPSGANVILTWPTNATGFTLQSTTNLVSTTVWSNVSLAAVVVNTNNAVTNALSGKQTFYRLSQ